MGHSFTSRAPLALFAPFAPLTPFNNVSTVERGDAAKSGLLLHEAREAEGRRRAKIRSAY